MRVFVFRDRLHAVANGEVYVWVGPTIVDWVAALSLAVKVEPRTDGWARCVCDNYVDQVAETLQDRLRLSAR